ncbi:MAG: hypothetical protein AAB916_02510 [Patescibacteria group bacterium]
MVSHMSEVGKIWPNISTVLWSSGSARSRGVEMGMKFIVVALFLCGIAVVVWFLRSRIEDHDGRDGNHPSSPRSGWTDASQ